MRASNPLVLHRRVQDFGPELRREVTQLLESGSRPAAGMLSGRMKGGSWLKDASDFNVMTRPLHEFRRN
jgi:hypothetical protein